MWVQQKGCECSDHVGDVSPNRCVDNEGPHWIELGEARIRLTKPMEALGLPLTSREQEILLLTAQGESVKSIARQLEISVHTVDTYRRRIYQKLGVTNAASAAALTLALCLGAKVEATLEASG